MSYYPLRKPSPLISVEDCVPGALVRAPGLECSIVTEGVIYVVLWKRQRWCSYRKGYWWAVGLQRSEGPQYMWPKVVSIGHLEPAFGQVFLKKPVPPKAPPSPQLELPFGETT